MRLLFPVGGSINYVLIAFEHEMLRQMGFKIANTEGNINHPIEFTFDTYK